MNSLIVISAVLLPVIVLRYVWKHRTGKIARGIGAAGATYNQIYGQGPPPHIPPPAATKSEVDW